MPMLSTPAFGPRTALGYVTVGALLCVWTVVWYFTRDASEEMTSHTWRWVAGLFFTGATFVFLGLMLGPLGRHARKAEMAPQEVTQAEAVIQQTAAAHPPAVMAPQPTGAPAPAPPAVAQPQAVPAPTYPQQ